MSAGSPQQAGSPVVTIARAAATRHLAASLAGAGWIAILRLVMIPFYIRLLGLEAYGLIGFYLALQAALQVLDFGLSPTMSRQLARYTATPNTASRARDFVRTIEVGYWILGLLLGGALFVAAPWLATSWLGASTLPAPVLRETMMLMGVVVALEWPLTLYHGALLGLQRIVALSVLNSVMATVTAGGALLVLKVGPASVTDLFRWLAVASAIHTLLSMWLLWRSMPGPPRRPVFDPSLLRDVRRFAAGVSGIMFTATILTQLDKLLLSKLVPLEQLGYYMVAASAATGIGVIVAPVYNVFFPRFSALVAAGDDVELRRLYHAGMQLLAALVAPVALLLAFFAPEILFAWTHNAQVVRAAAPVLRILAIGSALSGLMFLPYSVQLAHGWTKLYLLVHLSSVVVLVPSIVLLTPQYGTVVPALAWASLNLVWLLVALPATHRRFLPGATRRWLTGDVLPPVAASLTVVGISRWWISHGRSSETVSLGMLCLVVLLTLVASLLAARCTGAWAIAHSPDLSVIRRTRSRV